VLGEPVEDDGQHPGPHLLAEVGLCRGARGGDEQGVDLGEFGVVADGAGLLGAPQQGAERAAQPEGGRGGAPNRCRR
jgi:hypothetical protein